jgi:hypothetical protein
MRITQVSSPNHSSRSGLAPAYISLHVMAGGLAGTDSVFRNAGSKASSHYGVGSDGSVHQYVNERYAAWADGSMNSNRRSISIEHAGGLNGYANTDACVEASAQLCANIAQRMRWPKLVHGQNIMLHREIPPHTHPACPDKCVNPLRWQEIIDRANALLGNGPIANNTNSNKEDTMAIAYGSDQFKGIKYWDGIHAPVGIGNPDELNAINTAYKASNGKDLPLLTFNGAWAVRFEALATRSQAEQNKAIIEGLKKELEATK